MFEEFSIDGAIRKFGDDDQHCFDRLFSYQGCQVCETGDLNELRQLCTGLGDTDHLRKDFVVDNLLREVFDHLMEMFEKADSDGTIWI